MPEILSPTRNRVANTFRSALILGSFLVALAPVANAMPITGSISLNGSASYTTDSITFASGGANISNTAQTGSFTTLTGCTGCVTTSDITSFAGFSGPQTVFSESTAGFSVTLDSISSVSTPGAFLDLRGPATLSLAGYDDTPGILRISAQGPQNTAVTFSATARSVPEPASVLLLGVGLAGIGIVTSRRGRLKT